MKEVRWLEGAEEAVLTLGRERNPDQEPICVSLHPDTTTMAAVDAE